MADFEIAFNQSFSYEGCSLTLDDIMKDNGETQQLIKEFLFENVWIVLKGNLIQNQLVANEIFENAMEMGAGLSIECLQRTINMLSHQDNHVDGVMNPFTLDALDKCIKKVGVGKIMTLLCSFRVAHCLENMPEGPLKEQYIRNIKLRLSKLQDN